MRQSAKRHQHLFRYQTFSYSVSVYFPQKVENAIDKLFSFSQHEDLLSHRVPYPVDLEANLGTRLERDLSFGNEIWMLFRAGMQCGVVGRSLHLTSNMLYDKGHKRSFY